LTELRLAARAIVLDPDDRVLLVHWINEDNDVDVWLTPGGGLDEGEDVDDGLRRELREEAGLEGFEAGPTIWTRTHTFPWYGRTIEQRETFSLVRAPRFEPLPEAGALEAEGVTEVRWWTLDELEASSGTFAPRRLPELLRDLLGNGEPEEPIDVGV
jgi:ADP-ribose pyrophosphatase YjhB (NUDIX family)